jgi:hypothetical protein
MAQDPETGIDPVSTDGEGLSAEEKARREALKADPIAGKPQPPVNQGGSSRDRAAAADENPNGDDTQSKLFEMGQVAGGKFTGEQLFKKSIPRQYEGKMTGRRFASTTGGLWPVGQRVRLLSVVKPGKVERVPIYDPEDPAKVIEVIERQTMTTEFVGDLEALIKEERESAVRAALHRHGIEYNPEVDDPELRVVRDAS